MEYTIPAYGASTIGAIMDHANTLFELDIVELKDFRKNSETDKIETN